MLPSPSDATLHVHGTPRIRSQAAASYIELVSDKCQLSSACCCRAAGALRSPTCRALLDVLLRETLLLQVYREISTNVHDLAGMALGRTLKEQYEDQRKQVGPSSCRCLCRLWCMADDVVDVAKR